MRLQRVAKPFDNPDYIFELKHDGFRAIAYRRWQMQAGVLQPEPFQLSFLRRCSGEFASGKRLSSTAKSSVLMRTASANSII
jgi:hypothetical protein